MRYRIFRHAPLSCPSCGARDGGTPARGTFVAPARRPPGSGHTTNVPRMIMKLGLSFCAAALIISASGCTTMGTNEAIVPLQSATAEIIGLDRKSVVQGTRVSVRVVIGGARNL